MASRIPTVVAFSAFVAVISPDLRASASEPLSRMAEELAMELVSTGQPTSVLQRLDGGMLRGLAPEVTEEKLLSSGFHQSDTPCHPQDFSRSSSTYNCKSFEIVTGISDHEEPPRRCKVAMQIVVTFDRFDKSKDTFGKFRKTEDCE